MPSPSPLPPTSACGFFAPPSPEAVRCALPIDYCLLANLLAAATAKETQAKLSSMTFSVYLIACQMPPAVALVFSSFDPCTQIRRPNLASLTGFVTGKRYVNFAFILQGGFCGLSLASVYYGEGNARGLFLYDGSTEYFYWKVQTLAEGPHAYVPTSGWCSFK